MADDRNRAPRTNISGNTARAAARSTTAPQPAAQRSGPDPLVELARLIGQNEGSVASSAYEAKPPVGRRRDQTSSDTHTSETRGTAPRAAAPRAAAPLEPPAPPAFPQERTQPPSGGAEYERYPDQRYAGYADPHAADTHSPQARRSEPQAWRDPATDLADPYQNEGGWRSPRKRTTVRPEAATQRQDSASSQQDYDAAESRAAAERSRLPRTTAPTLPVQSEARRTAARAPTQAAAPIAPPVPAPAPRAAATRAAVAPARLDDLRETYARYAPAADGAYEAGDYYGEHPHSAGGQAGRGRDGYDDEDAYDDGGVRYEDQIHDRGRRTVWLALALVALAVVGTGGAYAVRSMFGGRPQNAPPPVIRADSSPKKIAAERPGDKQIQDRVGDGGVAERMVSREEKPVAIKDPNAPALVPGVGTPAEPPAVSAPATTSAADTRVAAPGASEPKRIRTVTIRPDSEPADAAPAPGGTARGAPAATPATPATARTVAPATPVDAKPQAAPAAPPAPRARTATAAPPPRANRGDYMVQLSAQKSEADAKNSFRVLKSKYSSVLGGHELHVKRKDLGSKGVYYGAQVGPFASRAEAAQLCDSLKAAGGTCLVERN